MNAKDQDMAKCLLQGYKTQVRELSAYKNIPIALLPYVRDYFRSQGQAIRVRYRGPRNNPLDTRWRGARMQDCVKQFADRFSVYF